MEGERRRLDSSTRPEPSGGLARCPADIVVAITGVAGPEPDEDGNPVGLVYVAAAARNGPTRVTRHEFGKRNKDQICGAAMGQPSPCSKSW